MMVSGQYYSPLLQDKVRPAVCCKQPELLERGVILLQDIAILHCQHSVQNLVQHWTWEVLQHPPCCPDLVPCNYLFFAHLQVHLQGKLLQLVDEIDMLSLPLYIIWARINFRAEIDHLPHSWEKCVDSAGDYIERRTYAYIQEYQLCCYGVFSYYNRSIHRTSEMIYVFKICYFCILILSENGAWLLIDISVYILLHL